MPSDRSRVALDQIHENILLAQGFCQGLEPDGFTADLRTVYAVTRCLEIISEASRRLSADVKARHAHIAWGQIAAAGNVYRHDYDGVRPDVLWRTVETALPALLAAVDTELRGD